MPPIKLPSYRRTALLAAAVAVSAAGASQGSQPAEAPDLTARVEAAVHTLASGSRVTGYPGNARAASYIEEGLRRNGCVDIRREQYRVAVPVEEGSRLVLPGSGEVIPVFGLWPNHVRTTTTPPEGIELPLVYGGWGEYADFEGFPLNGSAVLMEFNSWDHWTRAARFGARAFIFIEPEDTGYLQTLDKITSVPLDVPRFWIDRESGLKLRRRVAGGDPVSVVIHSRMDWREQPAWNIRGKVVGSDPELRDQTIVVDAYYDGISIVPALAPSAETSCSIVALLELARHLQSNPPARTVILSATGAHFQGHRGMIDFLNRHARKNEEYASWMEEPLNAGLFISLDLSSRTDQVAIWNNSDRFELKRLFVPFSRRFTRYAKEVASAQGREPTAAFANGISPIKGIDWSTLAPGGVPASGKVAMEAGQLALSFVTTHDARLSLNSPLDRAEEVRFGQLAAQIRFLNGILSLAFDDPELLENLEEFDPVLRDNLRTHQIKVRSFPRRAQMPNRPVPQAVVSEGYDLVDKGVHQERYYLTNEDGDATLHGLVVGYTTGISAFVLDGDTGEVLFAPDLSERAQKFAGKPGFSGKIPWVTRWTADEKTLVLFPCVPGKLFGLGGSSDSFKILDRSGRAPRQFGYSRSGFAALVYADRDLPEQTDGLKVMAGTFGGARYLLNSPGGNDESTARGMGYHFRRDTLTPTEFYVIRDMMRLNEARLHTMRKHAIENHSVSRFQQNGRRLLQRAEAALAEHRWDDYTSDIREAGGMIFRAYPAVIGTLNDVIFGMVFFLALVIPAAFFTERLVLASPDIRMQLTGFVAVLAVIWAIISQVHPAFAIAHPLVVLLAFAIMAMAVFVLLMVATRFNRYLREYRAEQARVHQTDISRFSAAYTAFMLGISNMRRRKLRTGLTLGTITLLTFTVLSFSSFKPDVQFFAFSHRHEGAYEGALIRHHNWDWIGRWKMEAAKSYFGERALLSPRNWYIADQSEEKGYIRISHGEHSSLSTALLGLSPQERGVTGVHTALAAGDFFDSPDEKSCLLSLEMAEILGVDAALVPGDSVRVLGTMLGVRGLFDADAFFALHDLDDEPLTPVDFHRSSAELMGSRPQEVEDTSEREEETRAFVHLHPDNVVILPFETLRGAGGELRSVAMRFESGGDIRGMIEGFITQTPMTLFAGTRDPETDRIRVASYTSVGLTAVEGFQALVIPMLIAGLIVLNAMMGAVYERFREIDIYSAVGLAPMHIALLFIAEACVYAVIGVTMGYLLGQTLGKAVVTFELSAGVNLNYSSYAAIASASVVMAVVLASTVYPARVASRAAVPDLVRRWKPPRPTGDRWEFEFPFMVSSGEVVGICGFLANFFDAYKEESIGDFYAEKVTLVSEEPAPGASQYSLQMLTWLAPFDMGVSQYLQLDFLPAADGSGIYMVEVFIQRLSGQDTYWQRVNQRFMNTLRKQFLLWHTLRADARAYHREKAEAMLGSPLPAS